MSAYLSAQVHGSKHTSISYFTVIQPCDLSSSQVPRQRVLAAMDNYYADDSGMCLCQQDSYLRSLDTVVVRCQPAAPSKPGPPSSCPATAADQCHYEVYLQESPMFPESGGQPCDTGQLFATQPDGTSQVVPVTEVVRREGALCHLTSAPLPPSCEVRVELDWGRRFDHMQQHTAQHVLSAVAASMLGAATVSWELHPLDPVAHGSGSYGCVAVDLTGPQLGGEQVSLLEAHTNQELLTQRAVTPLLLDPRVGADVDRISALTSDPTFRGTLPPHDKIKGNKLRLVCVEGLDINACGGTHVRVTGEVGCVKVVGVERTRGTTRVRFMAGGRLLAALGGCLGREAALTSRLNCGPARHVDMVDLLLKERRDGSKVRKTLAPELAELLGAQLRTAAAATTTTAMTAPSTTSSGTGPLEHELAQGSHHATSITTATANSADGNPIPLSAGYCCSAPPGAVLGCGGVWAIWHRSAADLDFLALVAAAALEGGVEADRGKGKGVGLRVMLLTGGGGEVEASGAGRPGAADSVELFFLVAGQPDLVKVVGPRVAEALGGRGGGRPGRFQGKAVGGLQRLPAAKHAFMEAVSAAAAGPRS